jgi:hypothetical protein
MFRGSAGVFLPIREGRMRQIAFVAAIVSLTLFHAPQAFANWSLGANLGVSFVNPEDGSSETVAGWPLDAFLEPGLRIGFAGTRSSHEGYLESGLVLVDSDSTVHVFELIGNYQYSFKPGSPTSPFLTAGVGLVNVDNGGSATSAMYGGGLGIWHRVAADHGRVRAEVRYDRVSEGDDNGVEVIDKAGIVGIKLGFDLWMK